MSMLLETLEYVAENAKIQIRVTPEAWEQIQETGRYMNQFESNYAFSSYTSKNLRNRKFVEEKMFGIDYEADFDARPVYAYLAYEEGPKIVREYGNIILVLKDEVKSRATFMYGDSYDYYENVAMDEGFQPSSFDNINENCVNNHEIDNVCARWDIIDNLEEYFEVQIYGGVTLDDIEEVIIL